MTNWILRTLKGTPSASEINHAIEAASAPDKHAVEKIGSEPYVALFTF